MTKSSRGFNFVNSKMTRSANRSGTISNLRASLVNLGDNLTAHFVFMGASVTVHNPNANGASVYFPVA